MKVKIPDLLKMAIEKNDMSLVCKAYTAITGEQIGLPLTISNEQVVAEKPKTTNLFVDDGSLARGDSPRFNPTIAKLYGNPHQRSRPSNETEVTCPFCGAVETISLNLASQYTFKLSDTKSEKPTFRCSRCSMSR